MFILLLNASVEYKQRKKFKKHYDSCHCIVIPSTMPFSSWAIGHKSSLLRSSFVPNGRYRSIKQSVREDDAEKVVAKQFVTFCFQKGWMTSLICGKFFLNPDSVGCKGNHLSDDCSKLVGCFRESAIINNHKFKCCDVATNQQAGMVVVV